MDGKTQTPSALGMEVPGMENPLAQSRRGGCGAIGPDHHRPKPKLSGACDAPSRLLREEREAWKIINVGTERQAGGGSRGGVA